MQKNNFLLLKQFKNTESAQLYSEASRRGGPACLDDHWPIQSGRAPPGQEIEQLCHSYMALMWPKGRVGGPNKLM